MGGGRGNIQRRRRKSGLKKRKGGEVLPIEESRTEGEAAEILEVSLGMEVEPKLDEGYGEGRGRLMALGSTWLLT